MWWDDLFYITQIEKKCVLEQWDYVHEPYWICTNICPSAGAVSSKNGRVLARSVVDLLRNFENLIIPCWVIHISE